MLVVWQETSTLWDIRRSSQHIMLGTILDLNSKSLKAITSLIGTILKTQLIRLFTTCSLKIQSTMTCSHILQLNRLVLHVLVIQSQIILTTMHVWLQLLIKHLWETLKREFLPIKLFLIRNMENNVSRNALTSKMFQLHEKTLFQPQTALMWQKKESKCSVF